MTTMVDKGRTSVSEGPDGELMLCWYVGERHEHGEHYIEVELFPDGRVEFFYKNRVTGQLAGYDVPVEVKNDADD